MAGSVNRVILIGNLGKDPETFERNGNKTVKFSIATSESWRDKATGERKEVTDWHNIVVFDKTAAEFAEKFLKKGMKVYVEGKQKTRKWTDKDGVDRYTTDTVIAAFGGQLQNLTRSDGASGGAPSEDDYGTPSDRNGRSASQSSSRPEDDGGDIPF
jgi:single-strand DNA-binding protein